MEGIILSEGEEITERDRSGGMAMMLRRLAMFWFFGLFRSKTDFVVAHFRTIFKKNKFLQAHYKDLIHHQSSDNPTPPSALSPVPLFI